MTSYQVVDQQAMDRLRALAATRKHRMAPDMVGEARNQKPLTTIAYGLVWNKLQDSPRKAGQQVLAIPGGEGEFVEEPGAVVPASRQQGAGPVCSDRNAPKPERDPAWPRWLHVGPGIYLFEDNVYRVYQSQYGNHYWQCKILNKDKAALDRGEPRWEKAPHGLLPRLRPEHEMNAEQSIKFEADYGITVCTECGAELENDLSKELRIGPVCRNKK